MGEEGGGQKGERGRWAHTVHTEVLNEFSCNS